MAAGHGERRRRPRSVARPHQFKVLTSGEAPSIPAPRRPANGPRQLSQDRAATAGLAQTLHSSEQAVTAVRSTARQGRSVGLQCTSVEGIEAVRASVLLDRLLLQLHTQTTVDRITSSVQARPRRLKPWGPLVISRSPGAAPLRNSRSGPRRPKAVIASRRCFPTSSLRRAEHHQIVSTLHQFRSKPPPPRPTASRRGQPVQR